MNGSYKMAVLEEVLWAQLGEVSTTNWQNFIRRSRTRAIEYFLADTIGTVPCEIDISAFFDQKSWRLFPVPPNEIYKANEAEDKRLRNEQGEEEPYSDSESDGEFAAGGFGNISVTYQPHFSPIFAKLKVW